MGTLARSLVGEPEVRVENRARLLGQAGAVGDVALEVMEMTGAPGDAYLTELRLLHTGAPRPKDLA